MAEPSTGGTKRSAEGEHDDAGDHKRPDYKEDKSDVADDLQPSPYKEFMLKPSSLKAPTFMLPTQKASAPDENSGSLMFSGLKTSSTDAALATSTIFSRLGAVDSTCQNSDVTSTSTSPGSRIFGSNLVAVVSNAATTGLCTTDSSTSSSSLRVFGAGLKGRVATSLAPDQPPPPQADNSSSPPNALPVFGAGLKQRLAMPVKPIFGTKASTQTPLQSSSDETHVKDSPASSSDKKEEKGDVSTTSSDSNKDEKTEHPGEELLGSDTTGSGVIETVFGGGEQSTASSSSLHLPEFHHQTGEENDKVVVQIQARLFTFDKMNQSWKERGRGPVSLNDICQSTSEGIFQSRLVMRMAGSRRVILNTNMWTEMTCERPDSNKVRFTGQDVDTGQIRIFLITGDSRSVGSLYSAMEKRLLAMRKSTGRASDDNSGSEPEAPGSTPVSPTPPTSRPPTAGREESVGNTIPTSATQVASEDNEQVFLSSRGNEESEPNSDSPTSKPVSKDHDRDEGEEKGSGREGASLDSVPSKDSALESSPPHNLNPAQTSSDSVPSSSGQV